MLRGINETSHNQTYIIDTRPGPNVYTATAKDLAGNTDAHSVVLYRQPTTVVGMKRVVERLEKRKAATEREIAELEDRKEELQQTNRNLEERLASLETEETEQGEVGSEGDDGGPEEVSVEEREQTLPGFTSVAALLAVVVGLFAVYRSRRGSE